MKFVSGLLISSLLGLFAAPSSTNYTLNAFDLGSGGGSSSSSNYGLQSSVGTQAGDAQSSANYSLRSGLIAPLNAYSVPAPALSNPSNYYNRLQLIVNQGPNPSDVRYAIAFSDDNFVTAQYVQNDSSLGPVLGIEDFQTYSSWGGAGGFVVTGLKSNTSYTAKVSAMQGNFTQSAYGPATLPVSTSQPSLSFAVTTSLSAIPPFNAAFGSLIPGVVVAAGADPIVTVSTNAVQGGTVYIRSGNAGLLSAQASYTLASATANLASNYGYGAQVVSSGQVSGGPFSAVSPFDGAGDAVGELSSTSQPLMQSVGPVSSGTATIRLKARTAVDTPSSDDYSDTISLTASMNY